MKRDLSLLTVRFDETYIPSTCIINHFKAHEYGDKTTGLTKRTRAFRVPRMGIIRLRRALFAANESVFLKSYLFTEWF